jgi:hypothetical protein
MPVRAWRISRAVGGEDALEILLAVDTQGSLTPDIINLFDFLIRLFKSKSNAEVHADVSLGAIEDLESGELVARFPDRVMYGDRGRLGLELSRLATGLPGFERRPKRGLGSFGGSRRVGAAPAG